MIDYLKKIVLYLNEYYHLIIVLFAFLLFIVGLFRPNKKSDFIRVFKLVNKAEELFPTPGSGAVKLAYVISQLPDVDTDKIISLVDEVLSSPQAKKIN